MMESISRTINRWVEFLLVGLGGAMTLIVALQVFFRYGLNHSLFWSEELARMILVWLTFLGASVAFRRKVHPGIDVVTRRLREPIQTWAQIAVYIICLFLFGVMVLYGARFSWFVRLQITPALSLPKWIMLSGIPLSGAILCLHTVALLFEEVRRNRP
jgi:TRAP-type C4-dicarboxylate transport system permease small subunit